MDKAIAYSKNAIQLQRIHENVSQLRSSIYACQPFNPMITYRTMNKNNKSNMKLIGGALFIVFVLVSLFLNQDEESIVTETAVTTNAPIAESTSTPQETPIDTIEPETTGELLWADADGDFDYYVLALSWQPTFCETRSDKPECATQTSDRYDATNFVLHGLWPNQQDDPSHSFAYCEQPESIIDQDDGDWCDLPPLSLSDTIATDLQVYMPGMASCLQNHEWYKHGVCADMSDDGYFALSNALVASFSQTEFNQIVADHIGQEVSRRDLLTQFETEFGSRTDDHLSLRCTDIDGISTLSEIRLVLKKELNDVSDFSLLFPTESVQPQGNCPQQFMIDGV